MNKFSLPQGLPARFTGQDGFDPLCAFLGIADREHKQFIVKAPGVKDAVGTLAASGSTSERLRLRIQAFYGMPDKRRDLWRHRLLAVKEDTSEKFFHPIPSFEYCSLKGYDPKFLDQKLNASKLNRAAVKIVGTRDRIRNALDAEKPAFAIWFGGLHGDVMRWKDLPQSRRDAIVPVLFSIATIIDDVQVLAWASEQVKALAHEYEFAVSKFRQDTTVIQRRQPQRSLITKPGAIAKDTEDIVASWRMACVEAASVATELGGDPPQPTRLDVLLSKIRELERLRDPLIVLLESSSADDLLDRIADVVAEAVRHDGGAWLDKAAGRILAQWKSYYMTADSVNLNRFRIDAERLEKELMKAVVALSDSNKAEHELKWKLDALEKESQGKGYFVGIDDKKLEIQRDLVDAATNILNARRHILFVVAPEKQTFNPETDYEHASGIVRTNIPEKDNRTKTSAHHTEDEESKAETASADEDDDQRDQPEVDPAGVSGTDDDASRQVDDPSTSGKDDRSTKGGDGTDQDRVGSPATTDRENNDALPAEVIALWRAIEADRFGIAYYISKFQAEDTHAEFPVPPPDLIAAVALANHVQSADDHVVHSMRTYLEKIDASSLTRKDAWQDQDALNLLLLSAAICPALLAPSTGAASHLQQIRLSQELTPVYTLAEAISRHSNRLHDIGLDAVVLKARLRGTWKDAFESFSTRLAEWVERAEAQQIIFTPANNVWKNLLTKDEFLGRLIALLSRNDGKGKETVRKSLNEISDQKAFHKLVWRADRRAPRRHEIGGQALKQLWNHVQPAIKLAREWLELTGIRPGRENFVERTIGQLRSDVLRLGPSAQSALEKAGSAVLERSMCRAIALKTARNAVDSLVRILGDTDQIDDQRRSPEMILFSDLVYVTRLRLGADFTPISDKKNIEIIRLLCDTEGHAADLKTAFEARLTERDLAGAQLVCACMEVEDARTAEECRNALRRDVDEGMSKLSARTENIEESIERAFCSGLIGSDERDDFSARIGEIRTIAIEDVAIDDVIADLVGAERELDVIGREFDALKRESVATARNRLRDIVSDDDAGRSVVERSIEDGHIIAANEQMDRLGRNETVKLPPSDGDPFASFLSFLDATKNAGSRKREEIVRAIRTRGNAYGLNFNHLHEEEVKRATDLIDSWHALVRSRRCDGKALQDLFRRLGFPVMRVSRRDVGGASREYKLETEPIEDRAVCPSRQFGSETRGAYRVLLNWEAGAYEAISRALGKVASSATLVLHFGDLGDNRDKLRREGTRTPRPFVVIDTTLIYFLAAHGSQRLPVLFRCALPFSSVEPYAPTSGLVPPELFYGREQQQTRIMDGSDSCFIYGGRQLGKTALLRRVENIFNRSGDEWIAKWVDLKVHGIGYERDPRDIWLVLQDALRQAGVLRGDRRDLDPDNRKHVQALRNSIKQWLAWGERKNRRILLLLDEADAFLYSDAQKHFSVSVQLRGLMEETDRKFKVVFAGLHNVMRTTQQANHPLAHLGEPIRVGAMLSSRELKDAQDLVCEPLRSIGGVFERDGLIVRILALTNYYPSLIQLYGAELARRLRDQKREFPYRISDDDVGATYGSRDLRDAIRERFILTLQLDPRYVVIAYALAAKLQGSENFAKGLSKTQIGEEARFWWWDGFDIPDIEFNMLLHEMEGLGVLRSIEEGRSYTLRNPNILLLLGPKADIEKALLDTSWEQPTIYEPASFRGRYSSDHHASLRRGPLTFRQESDLRSRGGVAIVFGCGASNIENLTDFLGGRIGSEVLPLATDVEQFKEQLKGLKPVRNEVRVYLVPIKTEWNSAWVDVADLVFRDRAKGRRPWIRVVFIATPRRFHDFDDAVFEGVETFQAGPCDEIFLENWLKDINVTGSADHVRELMERSGGWPLVLEMFGRKKPAKAWQTRIDELASELAGPGFSIEKIFGISGRNERVLRTLASQAGNPFGIEDIEIVPELLGISKRDVEQTLTWSCRFGFVSGTSGRQWMFNRLVFRLLGGSA